MAAHATHPSPVSRLFQWMRSDRNDMMLVLLYAVVASIVGLCIPIAVQAMVNTVAFGAVLQPILVLAILVLAALSIAAFFRALQARVVETLQERIFARTALQLSRRLPRVDSSVLDEAHGPELVNRFFDVLTIQKAAATLLVDGSALALQVLVGMVVLAFYHPYLLAFDAVLLASMVLLFAVAGRGAERTAIVESKRKYEVAAWLQEVLRHPVLFKGTGGEAFASARVHELTSRYLSARRAHFRVLFRQIAFALALQVVFSSILVAVGGFLVLDKQLTLGQLVAAELIVSGVLMSFSKVGKQLESLYDLLASFDKVGHLLDLPQEHGGSGDFRPTTYGPASLRIAGVGVRHGGKDVLADVSLDVNAGERLALVGANGSGKSTLLGLIYGLRLPERGTIEVDGETVHTLDPKALRAHVGLVRGIEIFEGTVLDNVIAGRVGVSRDDARAALEGVDLWDTVKSWPDGPDTQLHSYGTSLSLGQAQKLVLARAVAGKPRLLILDESLDGLDAEGRDGVMRFLFDAARPWTVLVTSHDPMTLRHCTRAVALEHGVVHDVSLAAVTGGAA